MVGGECKMALLLLMFVASKTAISSGSMYTSVNVEYTTRIQRHNATCNIYDVNTLAFGQYN